MGKPTGFMDYERQTSAAADPKERIKHFHEFHTPLSVEEQLAYYAELKKAGPKQTLEKVYSDGRIVTLDVYSLMVATQKTFTPGSIRDGGSVTYYTESRIDIKNLTGSFGMNVHFYVDHYKYDYGVGQESNTYLLGGTGNGGSIAEPFLSAKDWKSGNYSSRNLFNWSCQRQHPRKNGRIKNYILCKFFCHRNC